MHLTRILNKLLICLSLCFILVTTPAWARQEMRLAELNPDKTALGVFHSYKHQILLIALVQTDKQSFNCLPNHYYLYNYGTERYFEISAGNLKINSDFSRIFRTKVHFLSGVQLSKGQERDQVLKMLSRALKIPVDLIAAAQQKSSKPDRICWQQPELLDMQNRRLRAYPFLSANLCQSQWCSELYWKSPSHIRLWIHNKPKQFQLIELDVDKSTFSVKAKSARFVRQNMQQLNAPRENLFNSQTLNGKTLLLKKGSGSNVRLEWHKETSGLIIVTLIRKGADVKAADQEQSRFQRLVKKKAFSEALQSAEFALWLDPKNQTIKIDRMKVFLSMSLMSRFFKSLEKDFLSSDRFKACQKLHLDPSIRRFWKNDAFVKRFKEICSP